MGQQQQYVVESEPNSADSAVTSEYYPTGENHYDSDGQHWYHQYPYPYSDQYQYQFHHQLRTLGLYGEYDSNTPAVALKSENESENPVPLNWELEAHRNSESGIGWGPQVEYQLKQEFADYSRVSTPESVSTISESVDCTYDNLGGYVFGSQDASDDIDPNTLSPHDLHQFIMKEFERGCYLVLNAFGQFELLSESEYAQVAAGSNETQAQDEQLMLYNIAQQQEGFYVPEYPEY